MQADFTNEDQPLRKKQLPFASDNNEKQILDEVKCPRCKSTNTYGMSRVVGYFSVIDNWNNSKKAELKKRQKGNYWPPK
jgi:hypothetical protein